jgi:hypothetical protein
MPNILEGLFTRLGESHEASVYEAIERLVQAAEAVGLDDKALLRLLDQGLSLEDLLDLIEVRMRGSQRAA